MSLINISNLRFLILLVILTCWSSVHAKAACEVSIDANDESLIACYTQAKQEKSTRCFDKKFGRRVETRPNKDFSEFNFMVLHAGKTVCLNGHEVTLSGRKSRVILNPKDRLIESSIAGGFQYKHISTRTEHICGLAPNGKFPENLGEEYSFIPRGTPVTLGRISCLDMNTVTSSRVTLDKDTEICGAIFPSGTLFGPEDDGYYHFESSRDLKLINISTDGTKTEYAIKKGVDYRNKNPARHPCEWTATPKE